jgi:hypothetical protein
MDVGVDQPRQDEFPLEVDHLGGGANQRCDLSDEYDGVAF